MDDNEGTCTAPSGLYTGLPTMEQYRKLAACAYQFVGCHHGYDDDPALIVSWLDTLSAAADGNSFETEGLLPCTPQS